MKGRSIRAKTTKSERISCKGQLSSCRATLGNYACLEMCGHRIRLRSWLQEKTRVESAIFLFTRRVLALFRVNPAKSFNQPNF